jgi:hypothetical protein
MLVGADCLMNLQLAGRWGGPVDGLIRDQLNIKQSID